MDEDGVVSEAAVTRVRNPQAITAKLLAWYDENRRDLPWRRTHDPYTIWVAEVMLQQTQVTTVIPYYERFLQRFPTVEALARANLDDVLALWQGLGYYARARNLHEAAKIVLQKHRGQLPQERATLKSLPGIGPYTSAALASIAFGQNVPAIDANVVRVLCRLFDYADDPRKAAGKRALRRYAEALLPQGRAGDYNQAMMELGATICTKAPDCKVCPLSSFCEAYAKGLQAVRPVPRRRQEVPHRLFVSALTEREGRLLIVRRVPEGLLGGLWELPGGPVREGETLQEALRRHLQEELNLQATVGAQLGVVEHAYSHFQLTVQIYEATVKGEPKPQETWDSAHWLDPENRGDFGFTGVTVKILDKAPWAGSDLLL
ncbi:MAG: A/G-specific adenine glycosylase [Chloroflexota bacterium]|nr:A/G-specific adenine glycosylase [Chloroflexota bacterium]